MQHFEGIVRWNVSKPNFLNVNQRQVLISLFILIDSVLFIDSFLEYFQDTLWSTLQMTLVKQWDQGWEILEKRAMGMLPFHRLNEDLNGLRLRTSWRTNENHRELVDNRNKQRKHVFLESWILHNARRNVALIYQEFLGILNNLIIHHFLFFSSTKHITQRTIFDSHS